MKPKSIREYLETVSDKEMLKEIVNDFEQFVKDGQIGDCRLRSIERWIVSNMCGSVSSISPTTWFLRISFEAYRLLYEKESRRHNEFRERITNVVNYF